MYKENLNEEPSLKTVKLMSNIAVTLGVAKSTIFRTIKEYKFTGAVSTSKHLGGRLGLIACFDETTKNSVRRLVHAGENTTFEMKDVKELLLQALNSVTNINWKKFIEHVIKEEAKMYRMDGIMDDLIEPLIISLNNDTDIDSSVGRELET